MTLSILKWIGQIVDDEYGINTKKKSRPALKELDGFYIKKIGNQIRLDKDLNMSGLG